VLIILDVEDFLERLRAEKPLLLDARSPSEFSQAHIPGAVSFPLLNDEERQQVGITYKQKSKEAAVIKGFDLVGRKFGDYIRKAKALLIQHDKLRTTDLKPQTIFLYCWRGGMRSSIMSWVLRTAGFEVVLLKDGYKAYRNRVIEVLNTDKKIVVLGGKTGSGKTEMLEHLRQAGEQVICLETLANHRGSAFGAMGMKPQPRNEHFENMLAEEWEKIDAEKILWLENESQSIGSIVLPKNIFEKMRRAAVVEMERSKEDRILRIIDEYGRFPKDEIIACTKKIEQRLGGLHTQEAIEALQEGNREKWADIALSYYDKTYNYGIETRVKGSVMKAEVNKDETTEVHVQKLKEAAKKITERVILNESQSSEAVEG
jgi:tRNA 2-selenouridine synthase